MGNLQANIIRRVINVFSTEPELFMLAQYGKWEMLLLRTLTHPHEVFWMDRCGHTALHLVCRKKPPLDVVKALLRIFEQAASIQTTTGMTPLHFACFCDASPQVVELLIETCTKAVSMTDTRGRNPLHFVCAGNNTSLNSIRHLLQSDPSICCHADLSGRTPLYLTLDSYAESIEEQFDPCNKIPQERLKTLDETWECVKLLLKTAYYGTVGDLPIGEKFLLIHACVGVTSCPQRFVFLAVNLWPEKLVESDSLGHLPLHVAASNPNVNSRSNLAVIDILLQKYCNADRVFSANHSLPLELVFKNGNNWLGSAFIKILQAYPEAIATLDIDFRYFPHILALVGSTQKLEFMFRIIYSKPDLFRC